VIFSSAKPMANGAVTSFPPEFNPTVPGTYRWIAGFPGDANNNAFGPTTCNATGENVDVFAATATTVGASPEPSTSGQATTLTATVAARPGLGTPTGTVQFFEGATPLTGPLPLNGSGQASFTKSDFTSANHAITATYNPSTGSFFMTSTGSTTHTVNGATCTRGITGSVASVTANAGEYVCVVSANVSGDILARPGSSLVVFNSTVGGNLGGDGPTRFVVCGTGVSLNIGVQNATGWVLIGDSANDESISCAGNSVGLDISTNGNKAGTEIAGNSVNRDVFLVNTTGMGPGADDTTSTVEANRIGRYISCGGNAPPPTNNGKPNTVTPANRFYQCASL
jgi:hypothetical protein